MSPKEIAELQYNKLIVKKMNWILSKCNHGSNGCLEWTGGYFCTKGNKEKTYPLIYWNKKPWRGNRLVLALATNNFNTKLMSLHKCDNKKCLNVEHLYWGNSQQNVRDMHARGLARTSKVTHCPFGHKYSGDNLYIHNKKRYCRTCVKYRNNGDEISKELLYDIT